MTPGASATAPNGARSSPTPRNSARPRRAASTAPRWPRPAGNSAGRPAPRAGERPRRAGEKARAEIETITAKPWTRRVIAWELTGDQPKDLRLTWRQDPAARAGLEEEIFGKHVLSPSHDDWPVTEVVAGYRSQSEAEFSFRQMKDTRVVSFSPMFPGPEPTTRVPVFPCVRALQPAPPRRLKARRAGLDMSVRVLLSELAGISETV